MPNDLASVQFTFNKMMHVFKTALNILFDARGQTHSWHNDK